MKSVLKSATGQLGGITKHVISQIANMPGEVLNTVVGGNSAQPQSENQEDLPETMEQGGTNPSGTPSSNDYTGFATKGDYDRYTTLSDKKDDMELASIRKNMRSEFGLSTDVEEGMQKARAQRLEKSQEREHVGEKKVEQQVILEEQEQVESAQVLAAKGQSSAEQGIGKKIVG